MQNIFLLGLQNNCFLASQIRLSWKTKLLLLISHGPHAHMQHSGNLVGRILQFGQCLLQEPGGVLGVSRFRLGFRASLTTWRVLAPRGKAPGAECPEPGAVTPGLRAEPISGDMAGSHHGAPGVFPELGSSCCPRAGGLLLQVLSPAGHSWHRAVSKPTGLVSSSSASIRLANVQQNICYI